MLAFERRWILYVDLKSSIVTVLLVEKNTTIPYLIDIIYTSHARVTYYCALL